MLSSGKTRGMMEVVEEEKQGDEDLNKEEFWI